jgi:AcrR family transcriptional regulator
VAAIASELGMSPANVYRFFSSRDAINESICGRVLNEVADIAFAIARTNAPAMEKLDQLVTAVHRHNKMTLVKQRHMHDLIVAAMQENWAIIKAHHVNISLIMEWSCRLEEGAPPHSPGRYSTCDRASLFTSQQLPGQRFSGTV